MKRIIYIIALFVSVAHFSYAQGEVEALNYSRNGLYGTARAMGMGNAFGALGGDLTGVSINPAGIGVYRSSEIVGTLGFMSNSSEVGDTKESKSDFNVHNLGFVGYFPLRNETMPMINFGFTHNRQKSFNSNIRAAGYGASTMIDYIADRSFGVDPGKLTINDDKNAPDPFYDQPWLTVLGYNSWLINPRESGKDIIYDPVNTKGETPFQQINSYQRGYIDQYDFTIGTTINNVLNVGVAINIADIYHYTNVEVLEDFDNGGYTLGNEITVNASGVGAKFGLIYRPVNAIRLGLAYHTPMIYNFSERFSADMADDMGAYVTDPEYKPGRTDSKIYTNYYDLKTPGKVVLSGAAVLGNNFIVSADYEMIDYSTMRLKVPGGNLNRSWYDIDNDYIKSDFKLTSNLRLGMEYRFTQQLSGRLGYAWMQNPYNDDFKDAGIAAVSGSNTVFRMEGDTNYFTGGFGYRFSRAFYADIALVYQYQNDELYPFPNVLNTAGDLVIDAAPFDLKTSSIRGLLTLGYRF